MTQRGGEDEERTSVAFSIPQAVQILMQLQLNLDLLRRYLALRLAFLDGRRRRRSSRLDDRQRDWHEVLVRCYEPQARGSSFRRFGSFVLRFGGVEKEDLEVSLALERKRGVGDDAPLRLRRRLGPKQKEGR